jgi:cytochrome c oxidase subunit 4
METKAHAEGHITGFGIYVWIWLALIFLTVITVVASYIHFGTFNLIIALGIASLKASLVALYFMHLKFEDKITWVFFLYPLGLLALLIGLSMSDVFFRGSVSP